MVELAYNGTVKFSFNEGQHLYVVSKLVDKQKKLWSTPTPVVGATTIIGILAKPALINWAAGLAANYMRDEILRNDKLTPTKITQLTEQAKRAHIAEANLGKATGSVGHALVEQLVSNQKPTFPSQPEAKLAAENVVKAFEAWRTDFQPESIANERALYSNSYGFAGKFDLLANIDGKLTLVDFKTSKTSPSAPEGIYADNFAQLGGYLQLINEHLGVKVDEAVIVNLSKSDGSYKSRSLSDLGLTQAEAKLYFLNALGLYNLNSTFTWKMKGQ